MSVVLQFPKVSPVQRETSDALLTAEVIIFPGVRLERRGFEMPPPPSPNRHRRSSQAAIDEELA